MSNMANRKNRWLNKKFWIISGVVVGVILVFLLLSRVIVVDWCASPCRHDPDATSCIDSCAVVTLWDVITGNG